MRYENIEKVMIKFLEDPIGQVQLVERNKNTNIPQGFRKHLDLFRRKSSLEKFEIFLIDKLKSARNRCLSN